MKKLLLTCESYLNPCFEGDGFSFSKYVTFEASVLGADFFTAAAESMLVISQLLSHCLHL